MEVPQFYLALTINQQGFDKHYEPFMKELFNRTVENLSVDPHYAGVIQDLFQNMLRKYEVDICHLQPQVIKLMKIMTASKMIGREKLFVFTLNVKFHVMSVANVTFHGGYANDPKYIASEVEKEIIKYRNEATSVTTQYYRASYTKEFKKFLVENNGVLVSEFNHDNDRIYQVKIYMRGTSIDIEGENNKVRISDGVVVSIPNERRYLISTCYGFERSKSFNKWRTKHIVDRLYNVLSPFDFLYRPKDNGVRTTPINFCRNVCDIIASYVPLFKVYDGAKLEFALPHYQKKLDRKVRLATLKRKRDERKEEEARKR